MAVTPRETEAQRDLPHPEYHTTAPVSHSDILLTPGFQSSPCSRQDAQPSPQHRVCMGTYGLCWSWCLTTGRYLDNSQGWRHPSLVRAGPPNQKVEPPASPGPASPLRLPQLPSGSHQLRLWPRVCGVRGSRKNSRRDRQLPAGLASSQRGGQF